MMNLKTSLKVKDLHKSWALKNEQEKKKRRQKMNKKRLFGLLVLVVNITDTKINTNFMDIAFKRYDKIKHQFQN